MFDPLSIATFNTPRVPAPTLHVMHESMSRLYRAARELGGVTGQSAVARALNESPQTVKNWEKRGISAEGAITAERVFGCRAAWVRNRDGEMRPITIPVGLARETDTAFALGGVMSGPPGVAVDHTPRPPSLAAALEVVGMALAREMPERTRAEVAEALSAWARYAGRDRYRQTVTELLQEAPPLPQPSATDLAALLERQAIVATAEFVKTKSKA